MIPGADRGEVGEVVGATPAAGPQVVDLQADLGVAARPAAPGRSLAQGSEAVGVSVVHDAGALIAAGQSDRAVWAEHRVRLGLGLIPATTAPVVAQVSRSGRQVQLRRFLRGCDIVSFGVDDAHEVGVLAGHSGSKDVIDVHVVATAHQLRFGVVTSDLDDLAPISDALRPRVPLMSL